MILYTRDWISKSELKIKACLILNNNPRNQKIIEYLSKYPKMSKRYIYNGRTGRDPVKIAFFYDKTLETQKIYYYETIQT